MAPRGARISYGRRVGPLRASIALTWAGTQWSNPVLLNGDVAFQDLSSNLDVRLGRNITNAVVQTVRGGIRISTSPATGNAFTRMIMSMGIVWADKDFVDPSDTGAGSGANFPNPLSESMKWIWRYNYIAQGTAVAADILGGLERSNAYPQIDVHVKVKRKQPSLNHRLYIFWAKTTPAQGFDANLNATPAQLTGAVNLLMKTP